ncbi:MAG: serine/threonine protein kinase [Candidatus Melainabacteria bacterium]|nr:serine/threonine protein kinase [Candidatus Melainabacteria bacterium]
MPENDRKIHPLPYGEAAHALAPGTIIAQKYKIISLLGSGGMGSVYKVRQTELGKNLALKVLDVHKQSSVAVRRFQQEAKTAAALRHPNLVEVHDFGVFGDSQPYLVMDFVDGQSLDKLLKVSRTLPVDYVVALAIQVGFGLMYAHSQGVVHRDIKPGNIIVLHPNELPSEGTIKIVDFGIAKLMQSEDGQIQELTRTGEIFGSPIYMSPEQCRGTAVDQRTDIYSLGCVMYECLTGLPPFVGDTAMSTMVKRLTQTPASLKDATIGLDFPPALEIVVRKMLATEPEDRYKDFNSAIRALMLLSDPDAMLPSSSKISTRKTSYLKDLALVIVTATVCFLATHLIDRRFFVPPLIEPEINKPNASMTLLGTAIERPTRTLLGEGPQSREVLNFPSKAGSISVGDEPSRPALGEIVVPAGSLVSLNFNEEAAADPKFLENLTDVKFANLNFNAKVTVSNESMYMFENLKHVVHYGLSGCAISTLRPIYNSPYVTSIDVTDTHVSSQELFQCNFFNKLLALNFGPVGDPLTTIEALANNSTLNFLKYTGPVASEHKTNARGLSAVDVDGLVKIPKLSTLAILNSPEFDDACLKRLLQYKKLKDLELRECGITTKSIPTLKNAKLLKFSFTPIGWSSKDLKLLRTLPYSVELQERAHVQEVNKLQSAVDANSGFLFDKYDEHGKSDAGKSEQTIK